MPGDHGAVGPYDEVPCRISQEPGYQKQPAGPVMRKTRAILGSALFFVLAPCLAAGVIPWWISHWHVRPSFWDTGLTRSLGVVLTLAGVAGVVASFARFALQGRATQAPIAPLQHLVVSGLYRHVRNPMHVSVLAVIFGPAPAFAGWHLA